MFSAAPADFFMRDRQHDMKTFEFTLQRMLEFRRQQAEAERSRLQRLFAQLNAYEDEQIALRGEVDLAREAIADLASLEGQHLASLASFQGHAGRRSKEIDRLKAEMMPEVERQRLVVVESDRKVKLLDRLREQKYREWLIGRDKEIDELAADSYLARLSATRRTADRRNASYEIAASRPR